MPTVVCINSCKNRPPPPRLSILGSTVTATESFEPMLGQCRRPSIHSASIIVFQQQRTCAYESIELRRKINVCNTKDARTMGSIIVGDTRYLFYVSCLMGQYATESSPSALERSSRLQIVPSELNSYSAGIDFSRQNLTSVDVRF